MSALPGPFFGLPRMLNPEGKIEMVVFLSVSDFF